MGDASAERAMPTAVMRGLLPVHAAAVAFGVAISGFLTPVEIVSSYESFVLQSAFALVTANGDGTQLARSASGVVEIDRRGAYEQYFADNNSRPPTYNLLLVAIWGAVAAFSLGRTALLRTGWILMLIIFLEILATGIGSVAWFRASLIEDHGILPQTVGSFAHLRIVASALYYAAHLLVPVAGALWILPGLDAFEGLRKHSDPREPIRASPKADRGATRP